MGLDCALLQPEAQGNVICIPNKSTSDAIDDLL